MHSEQHFDIIIAGTGASGLTLLWYILQSEKLKKKRVLLIDKKLEPTDSKTWCFWSDGNHPTNQLIHHTWNELEVITKNETINGTLNQKKYHSIRSLDYSTEILKRARLHPQVKFLETEIQGFTNSGENGVVHTGEGSFSALWVFQSALLPPDFHNSVCDLSLLQHFTGWEIETTLNMFNPDKALLMDFNVAQREGATFFYLLPYSENSALVEYTLFSPDTLSEDEYENELRNYLSNKYNLDKKDYTITRRETGVVPMEDRKYAHWYCNRVLNIGTAGGFTKATTGYTFSRIHDRCRLIVKSLEDNAPLPDYPVSSYRFRVYDIMMLYLLQHESEQAVEIFGQLFKKNSFDLVLRFLNEETSISEELSIFSKLSYMPFFRSIYKMKHRIFFGA
jgi:lycopene beta-cyclase